MSTRSAPYQPNVSSPLLGFGTHGSEVVIEIGEEVVDKFGLANVAVGVVDTTADNPARKRAEQSKSIICHTIDTSQLAFIERQIETNPLYARDFDLKQLDLRSINPGSKGNLRVPQRTAAQLSVPSTLRALQDDSERVFTRCSYPVVPHLIPHKSSVIYVTAPDGSSGNESALAAALLNHIKNGQYDVGNEHTWSTMILIGHSLHQNRQDYLPIQESVEVAFLRKLNILIAQGTNTLDKKLSGPLPGWSEFVGGDNGVIPPGCLGAVWYVGDFGLGPYTTLIMVKAKIEAMLRIPQYADDLKGCIIHQRDSAKNYDPENALCFTSSSVRTLRQPEIAPIEQQLARHRVAQIAVGQDADPRVNLGFQIDAFKQLPDQLIPNLRIQAVGEIAEDFIDNSASAAAVYVEKLGKQPAAFKREFSGATPGRPLDVGHRANALAGAMLAEIDTHAARGNLQGVIKAVSAELRQLVAVRDLPYPEEEEPDAPDVWAQTLARHERAIRSRREQIDQEYEDAKHVPWHNFITGVHKKPDPPQYNEDSRLNEAGFAGARYIQGQMLRQARQVAWEKRRGITEYVITRIQGRLQQLQSLLEAWKKFGQAAESQAQSLWQECQTTDVINFKLQLPSLETMAEGLGLSPTAMSQVIGQVNGGADINESFLSVDEAVISELGFTALFTQDKNAQQFLEEATQTVVTEVMKTVNQDQLPPGQTCNLRLYIRCFSKAMEQYCRDKGYGEEGAGYTIVLDEGPDDWVVVSADVDTLPARAIPGLENSEFKYESLDEYERGRRNGHRRFAEYAPPLCSGVTEPVAQVLAPTILMRRKGTGPVLYLEDESAGEFVFGDLIPPEADCPLVQIEQDVLTADGERVKKKTWAVMQPMPTGDPMLFPLDTERLSDVPHRIYRNKAAFRYLRSYVSAMCQANGALVSRAFMVEAEKQARGWLERQKAEERIRPFSSLTDPDEMARRKRAMAMMEDVGFLQESAKSLSIKEDWVAAVEKQAFLYLAIA